MMSADRHASSTPITPEESNLFLDILHEAPLFGHRKPTSIVGSIFYCLLLAGYATLAVGSPWIFHHIQEFILPLLCSCDVALLIVTGIFQQYLVCQVQKIRLQGFYIFSQKVKHIVRLPFASTSYGTAAMLLVMVWKPHISILSIPMLLSCSSFQMNSCKAVMEEDRQHEDTYTSILLFNCFYMDCNIRVMQIVHFIAVVVDACDTSYTLK